MFWRCLFLAVTSNVVDCFSWNSMSRFGLDQGRIGYILGPSGRPDFDLNFNWWWLFHYSNLSARALLDIKYDCSKRCGWLCVLDHFYPSIKIEIRFCFLNFNAIFTILHFWIIVGDHCLTFYCHYKYFTFSRSVRILNMGPILVLDRELESFF